MLNGVQHGEAASAIDQAGRALRVESNGRTLEHKVELIPDCAGVRNFDGWSACFSCAGG
jgi:hypothetical protein